MTYSYPKDSEGITEEALLKMAPEIQKDFMREWFLNNYENPVECLPYDSEEGGYIYIWGGPYDPLEELESKFSGIVPNGLIMELSKELSDQAFEWSGKPDDQTPDDYYVDAIQSNTDTNATAKDALKNISCLLDIDIPEHHLKPYIYRLLYINAITCLEAYLSDTFSNQVVGNEKLMRRFVHTSSEFKKRKLALSNIYERMENISEELREHLSSLMWHNLSQVKRLYESVFEIRLPDISKLVKAVRARHDLVHRNGRTKEGNKVNISEKEVHDLIQEVKAFINEIDQLLRPVF
ncbi:MAG: hypothetical protein DRP65_08620 [Planctomycetota bacterium]|nr:MAG: hypothetical protein DRP65_08620 [Planctomycetota bacterium]